MKTGPSIVIKVLVITRVLETPKCCAGAIWHYPDACCFERPENT
jgi:hypothetical protein